MTKIDLLELLSDGEWWTSPGVQDSFGVPIVNASNALRRAHQQGLLRRQQIRAKYNPPRLYRYQITQKGLGRLDFLTSGDVQAGGEVAEGLGLGGGQARAVRDFIAKGLGAR